MLDYAEQPWQLQKVSVGFLDTRQRKSYALTRGSAFQRMRVLHCCLRWWFDEATASIRTVAPQAPWSAAVISVSRRTFSIGWTMSRGAKARSKIRSRRILEAPHSLGASRRWTPLSAAPGNEGRGRSGEESYFGMYFIFWEPSLKVPLPLPCTHAIP